MPIRPPVHRPKGWRDKAARDRDYLTYRDQSRVRPTRTAAWKRARRAFLAEHPVCAVCGAPATVVDHIVPHRGDLTVFWDRSRWQALCASCHGRKTAARDGGFGNPLRPPP
ncbi:HNH endonuclease [Roseospira visakhapatnamensis]|uniref:Putative HNH nuclease YajD n=1 Tax=Roseospira visakhapatnamensis TaxID=390880 RepID=A0A7W6RFH7_9PROT|nr:HNH endonuclease [Roseospira visakhapatnamensis]MBB4267611.1 5-methylcytosine-specific restriction protein A [Roseospira visakhapatnamensis]